MILMQYKRTLGLTSDGDLRTNNRGLVAQRGVAGVEQELRTTLATIQGEDPFDENHGLRMSVVAGSDEAIIEREVRNTLLEDDRVDSVDSVGIGDRDEERQTPVTVDLTLVDGTGLEFSVAI